MKCKYLSLAFVCLLIMAHESSYAQAANEILEPGSKPILISKQFSFTEGPAVDKAGNIFFTDQPNNSIWEFDLQGKLTLFMRPSGRSNGMYFDHHGHLITCADENNQLWQVNGRKEKKILLRSWKGKKFNGPNDLWIDAADGIYFTDPYYQRDYWTRKKPELPGEYLYYLPHGSSQAIILDSTLKQPNGIAGSADGKFLFVADIGDNKTYRYRIDRAGHLSNRILLVQQGSDGMTLDEKGNLYLTGNGVTVYAPNGTLLTHIDIPEKWTANLCFGGKDRRTLLITASESVYILHMKVKGIE